MFISSDPSILGARTSLENVAESRLILVFSKLIRSNFHNCENYIRSISVPAIS